MTFMILFEISTEKILDALTLVVEMQLDIINHWAVVIFINDYEQLVVF